MTNTKDWEAEFDSEFVWLRNSERLNGNGLQVIDCPDLIKDLKAFIREQIKLAEERGRLEGTALVKGHIGEWDSLSLNDAEFRKNVRHYFAEIARTPNE